MSQSFHGGLSTSAHRRRTDLMPTITPSSMATGPTGVGTRTPSRAGANHDSSRSSTPGKEMLRSVNAGRAMSMSRLDSLSKPRVLVVVPASHHPHQPQHLQHASTPKRISAKKSGFPPKTTKITSSFKSVSLVQLNNTSAIDKSPESLTRSITFNAKSVETRPGKFCDIISG